MCLDLLRQKRKEQEQIRPIVIVFSFSSQSRPFPSDDDDRRNSRSNSSLYSLFSIDLTSIHIRICYENVLFSMLPLFSRQSTWLILEICATSLLTILNLCIPIFLSLTSFRNLINFYFSSLALSSSLINLLYLFYLIQTFREKILSELNCRAMFYLQTSCILVLGRFNDDDLKGKDVKFFSSSSSSP